MDAPDPVALLSESGRAERSRVLAAWLGLPDDAVAGFVERMELSWQRQQAFEMERVRPASRPTLIRRLPRRSMRTAA